MRDRPREGSALRRLPKPPRRWATGAAPSWWTSSLKASGRRGTGWRDRPERRHTSFHLRVLATTGLVTTRREGTRIYYRLASNRGGDLWAALRDVTAQHHEQLDELALDYLGDRSRLEQIDRHELVERIAAGDVVVVDVRPSSEYAVGHIAGARSIPIEQLAASIEELPDGLEVVAYCRRPYCVFADDAVRIFTNRGLAARRLEDGYPEWQRADLPVEIAATS